jgi:hypothetical protein
MMFCSRVQVVGGPQAGPDETAALLRGKEGTPLAVTVTYTNVSNVPLQRE